MSKKSTETSEFGISKRENHNSEKFYKSKLYNESIAVKEKNTFEENFNETNVLNKIYCKTSENMNELLDDSVHLVVTSPPYNVSKEYDEDLSLEEYRTLLKNVFTQCYKKLATGGRLCINIANVGRKPYVALHSYIIEDMLGIGYLMRGEIIWNKAGSASPSTAWGSWQSASNPVLRDIHEYILVFSKDNFTRRRAKKENTITKDEFLEYTKSVWEFSPVSAKSIGHPAPFPEELPYRLIQLYSFAEDVVLDPFCGSGTTCLVAAKCGRFYVGYDTNENYVKLAEKRISKSINHCEISDFL